MEPTQALEHHSSPLMGAREIQRLIERLMQIQKGLYGASAVFQTPSLFLISLPCYITRQSQFSIFSVINKKSTVGTKKNPKVTLGTIEITSPFKLFKNCSS